MARKRPRPWPAAGGEGASSASIISAARAPPTWAMHAAFTALGISSFLLSNGLWAEMAALIRVLPEGNHLGSYLLVSLQAANIVPALAMVESPRIRGLMRLETAIWLLLVCGFVLAQLISFGYSYTADVRGDGEHAVALIVLVFLCGCVNNSSSLALYPFTAKWERRYVSSLAVGEGFSGVLVSLIALAQDVGGASHRFSIRVYFQLLSLLYLPSAAAFVMLLRDARRREAARPLLSSPIMDGPGAADGDGGLGYERMEQADSPAQQPPHQQQQEQLAQPSSAAILRLTGPYLAVQFVVCGLAYGVLPAILPIATTGYRDATHVLQYSSFVSMVADPVSRFLTHYVRVYRLRLLLALVLTFAAVIIAASAASPNPPLAGLKGGGLLIVLCNGLFTASFAFCSTMVYFSIHKALGPEALREQHEQQLQQHESRARAMDGPSSAVQDGGDQELDQDGANPRAVPLMISAAAAAADWPCVGGDADGVAEDGHGADNGGEDDDHEEREQAQVRLLRQEGFKWSAFTVQAGAFVGALVTWLLVVLTRE